MTAAAAGPDTARQRRAALKHAEQVTFGGGGLDRAAHVRSDQAALAAAWETPAARVLLMWRGKPLTRGTAEGGPSCGLAI